MKNKQLLLGAHMSTDGGPHTAFERGASIGCTTMQIFTKSNRQWHAKPLTEEEIVQFTVAQKQYYYIYPIITHAAYLINLASDSLDTRKKSIKALIDEIRRCEQLNIPILVLHPGSRGNLSEQEGINYIAEGLTMALENTKGLTTIALETMAGQGTSLGSIFEQLAIIRERCVHKKQIKICFDTCHVFAAGYPLHEQDHYEKIWETFDKIIGLSHLAIIHINDSKKEYNSHVDRHEDIGQGKIGVHFFESLFNDERFFDIPKILETPKTCLQDDVKNFDTIKNLISAKTKKLFAKD